jgi:hypothetical protein
MKILKHNADISVPNTPIIVKILNDICRLCHKVLKVGHSFNFIRTDKMTAWIVKDTY